MGKTFELTQLLEHKLCFSGETHVDAFVLVVRVVFVCLVCLIHKIGLYTLLLQYEGEYT